MAKLHHLILLLLLFATLQSSSPFVSASPSNHIYNVGQNVPFFVNKLGPFNNPRSLSFIHFHFHSIFIFIQFLIISFSFTVKHINTINYHSANQVNYSNWVSIFISSCSKIKIKLLRVF